MNDAGPPLRVVLFGTPAFAVPTLRSLVASRHPVVGVVTQPDRPRGRGQKVTDAPVKALAVERGIPVLQPERLTRDGFADLFAAWQADLGVVAAYGKILPEWLLHAPRLGMINVHASLLPKHRGAAPVHRSIIAGDPTTGVTIMRVVKALDAGPMLARVVRPLTREDTSDAVERDLATLGADLLLTVVDQLARGPITETPQQDAAATYAPRLTKEEGRLNFADPASTVHNRVRGLRPWPAAYTFLNGARLVIHHARLSPHAGGGASAGTCVIADGQAITIACGDGQCIDVLQIQPEGRRVMAARDFLAGHGRLTGQVFG
ncbi:MAG TPA: methionyl-tRNA formyltransferase [Vicinamibacterales bacterium]|nr:methionyl-tRNA formyltransferase [Vicinamibacterales bacterium]